MSPNRRRPKPLRAVPHPNALTDPISLGDEPTSGFTYLDRVWTHEHYGIGLALAQELAGEANQ